MPRSRCAPGDSASQVAQALGGPPDSGLARDPGRRVVSDRLGLRLRFDQEGKVALVTISRPSSARVANVKLGDPPARIRQAVGSGIVTTDLDNSETYTFPDRGVAFVVRNAEVALITLFPKRADIGTPTPAVGGAAADGSDRRRPPAAKRMKMGLRRSSKS